MNQVLLAFLISLAAGLTTSIGGILAFFVKKDNMKVLAFGLSFSAGVMLYLSFMEILPESMNWLTGLFGEKKGSLISVCTLMAGIVIAALIDFLMPDHVTGDMLTDQKKKLKSWYFCSRSNRNSQLSRRSSYIYDWTQKPIIEHSYRNSNSTTQYPRRYFGSFANIQCDRKKT